MIDGDAPYPRFLVVVSLAFDAASNSLVAADAYVLPFCLFSILRFCFAVLDTFFHTHISSGNNRIRRVFMNGSMLFVYLWLVCCYSSLLSLTVVCSVCLFLLFVTAVTTIAGLFGDTMSSVRHLVRLSLFVGVQALLSVSQTEWEWQRILKSLRTSKSMKQEGSFMSQTTPESA